MDQFIQSFHVVVKDFKGEALKKLSPTKAEPPDAGRRFWVWVFSKTTISFYGAVASAGMHGEPDTLSLTSVHESPSLSKTSSG